jgi:DNA repair photolyase
MNENQPINWSPQTSPDGSKIFFTDGEGKVLAGDIGEHEISNVRELKATHEMNEQTETDRNITDFWHRPAVIAPNNFINKSLSNWAFNIAVGCTHACRFCYVPEVSTRRMGGALEKLGVEDPDAEWGNYVFLRPFDEHAFLTSLSRAQRTPVKDLNADGNRAIMFCTTTDPYMVIKNADPAKQRELNAARAHMVRRALELIRDHSDLNVRILTRSPLARADFDVMASMGNRLLFGMSLPTMRDDLARIYEPSAPGPRARLATLDMAVDRGIPVYVAMAPTFPECDEKDITDTMEAIAALDPVTIFHEPINIRAENVERIAEHARKMGVTARTEVFATKESWQAYAFDQLHTVEEVAENLNLSDRLHLWPDAALKKHAAPEWLARWWGKISAWPCSTQPTATHAN